MTDNISRALAATRHTLGLTQQQVARRWNDRYGDGKTFRDVSRWETGAVTPTLTVLTRLAELYGCPLSALLGERAPARHEAAIAVVTHGRQVLLVLNRDSGRWQFPAGTIKPGKDPATTALRECLAETGVRATARRELGQRLHPRTGVWCHYFACDYLAGDVVNGDLDENQETCWVPIAALAQFIPTADLFEPVAEHLGVRTGCLQSA